MNIDELGNVITVFGAAIAAVASVWSLALQIRGKRDRFTVQLGGISPSTDQETMLHVVSLSDHTVRLADWGFIEADGRFRSFQLDCETGDIQAEQVVSRGDPELDTFGAYFEAGYVRKKHPAGVFARSITQCRPRVRFDASTQFWRRAWIRLRLLVDTKYLGW